MNWLSTAENVTLAMHDAHWRSDVTVAFRSIAQPGRHTVTSAHAAWLIVLLYPASTSHGTHTRSAECDGAGSPTANPAVQLANHTHWRWLVLLVNVDVGQAVQRRSAAAVGVDDSYEPGSQLAHGVHAVWPERFWNLPASHAAQVRSDVGVGVSSSLEPGGHT